VHSSLFGAQQSLSVTKHKGMGAIKEDMLLILYIINIAQVTGRGKGWGSRPRFQLEGGHKI